MSTIYPKITKTYNEEMAISLTKRRNILLSKQKQRMKWNIYNLASPAHNLNGVMLRGRIRKFGIVNNITILAENTEDVEDCVRIALLSEKSDSEELNVIREYLRKIIPDIEITVALLDVVNPVLSKLKCNYEDRYEI